MNARLIALFSIVTMLTIFINEIFSINVSFVTGTFEALFLVIPGLAGISLMFFILAEPVISAIFQRNCEKEDAF
jgi:uncharacterized membrane protein